MFTYILAYILCEIFIPKLQGKLFIGAHFGEHAAMENIMI